MLLLCYVAAFGRLSLSCYEPIMAETVAETLATGNLGAQALAQAFEKACHLSSLKQLHLANNCLGNQGIQALAQSIEKAALLLLEDLNLAWNEFQELGAKALAQALVHRKRYSKTSSACNKSNLCSCSCHRT